MGKKSTKSNRKESVDLFWEAIPPLWDLIRSQLDKNARDNFEITGGHFHVLRRIKRGDATISNLADARHISRPVVSRKVDSLVEKGLVSRRESPEDRRFTVLELTPQGDQILEVLRASNREWLEDKLGSLDNQELEIVIEAFALLKKISN